MGTPAEANAMPPPAGAVLDRLLTRGWEFDYFQAVWLLERALPGRRPVGGRGPVADEPIRFRPHVSLGFPPTDVRRVTARPRLAGNESSYRMDISFLGLYGVSTPLPLHYAIDILRAVEPYEVPSPKPAGAVAAEGSQPAEEEATPSPVRDFLDIFHHRLISLFYRGWAKYRYYATFGMPPPDPDTATITDFLLWLIGCTPEHDQAVLGVSPIRLIRYAGLLTQHPKSAVALEGLLSDYWGGLPVRVQPCVGRWVPLAAPELNRLGLANSRLGVDLTVGEEVYDLSGAFHVVLGPVDWATYLSFLPRQERHQQTCALVCFYCSDPLSFALTLCLRAGEVPEMRLSSTDPEAAQLGFTSWARTAELPQTTVTFGTTGPRSRRIEDEHRTQN